MIRAILEDLQDYAMALGVLLCFVVGILGALAAAKVLLDVIFNNALLLRSIFGGR